MHCSNSYIHKKLPNIKKIKSKQVKLSPNLVNHKQSKQKFINKLKTFPETSVILKVYDSSESAVSFTCQIKTNNFLTYPVTLLVTKIL